MAAEHDPPVLLQVRGGEVVTGSWLYIWLDVPEGKVLYVGATGLPPQVRTWLHLHDPDPDVGRLVARHPAVLTDPVDVLAFPVPDWVDRKTAKVALIAALDEARLLSTDYVGDPPGALPADADGSAELVASAVVSISAHRPTV